MNDASLTLDSGESITIRDMNQGIYVFVWIERDGGLSVSINRGHETRDNLQVRYVDSRLVSVTSPEGEPVCLTSPT